MSEDRKRLEEQVLKQSIPVSKITEDKIQAAYDIVRAKSRQKRRQHLCAADVPSAMFGRPAWQRLS